MPTLRTIQHEDTIAHTFKRAGLLPYLTDVAELGCIVREALDEDIDHLCDLDDEDRAEAVDNLVERWRVASGCTEPEFVELVRFAAHEIANGEAECECRDGRVLVHVGGGFDGWQDCSCHRAA
jgi:hypothetical protein